MFNQNKIVIFFLVEFVSNALMQVKRWDLDMYTNLDSCLNPNISSVVMH